MATKKKSYLKKSLNELLDEMDNLGGGINVKLSSQELICLLPALHNPLLTQGQSEKDHEKDNKYVLLSSSKQSKAVKKKFKYTEVCHKQDQLIKNLLDKRHFCDWFLQGFNLNMIFFGRAVNIHNLAIQIINKYEEASQNLRIQTVRFSPRTNDNFYTENIEDLFGLREITKVEESGSFIGKQAIKYLENLQTREQLETKIKKIQTEIVRITFNNGNKQCELNLINLYDDLFIHSTYQTKYEHQFEKALLNILSECKAMKYLSNSDNLSRVTFQKTRLLDYLQRTVFSTAKNIIVSDYSIIENPSSNMTKYENLLMRLMCIDRFNDINTVCHRYSSKAFEQTSDYQSNYNTITHRYNSNVNDDSYELNNEKSTKRRYNFSQDGLNKSPINQAQHYESSKSRQVTSFSPNQSQIKCSNYDYPLQQQYDIKPQNSSKNSNEGDRNKSKRTFKQEMKDLLKRINPKEENDEEAEDCKKDIENIGKNNLEQQNYDTQYPPRYDNQHDKKQNVNSSQRTFPHQSQSIQRDHQFDYVNERQDDDNRMRTFQTQMSQNTLHDISNQSDIPEKRSQLVSKKYQNLQQQQSNQHKQLLEECYQQRIEELNLEIQEIQTRYEIELSEQREIIKNQSKKITLLGAENNLSDLILAYEAEIFRYVKQQKTLREQINYLTDVKITKENQKNLNTTQKQNIKFKEMIASLNIELIERDEELAKLKREKRQIECDSLQHNRKDKRISDLENQRDQLLSKNDELMNSLQQINQIVASLKQENLSLNKCVSTLTKQNQELSEDNQTIQQILSLQSKESTNKIVSRRVSATNVQLKNQGKSQDKSLNNGQVFAFSTIEKCIQTLKRLVLKTGSGIPEEILSSFSADLKAEWMRLIKNIEYYKQNNQIVSDFLTNFISSLEVNSLLKSFLQIYGKNDKNVREMNKFVRNFLLESLNNGEDSDRQFKEELINV